MPYFEALVVKKNFLYLICNLHMIGNHCTEYEHPWSKKLNSLNERGACIMSRKTEFKHILPWLLTPWSWQLFDLSL